MRQMGDVDEDPRGETATELGLSFEQCEAIEARWRTEWGSLAFSRLSSPDQMGREEASHHALSHIGEAIAGARAEPEAHRILGRAARRVGRPVPSSAVARWRQRCWTRWQAEGDDSTRRGEDEVAEYLLYQDLAEWWPLLSPPEDYRDEAAFLCNVIARARRPVREVLELGSGGGHNASHLKLRFTMTLVDRSEPMLRVSRRLNPECEHIHADMLTLRLDRRFDAVLVHDAIEYMTTERQLRQAIETASTHCMPGGLVVLVPDHTAETFDGWTDYGGSDQAGGRGARYLEWSWDPDPADTTIRTEYSFVLRRADGTVETAHEAHVTGLFSREVWRGLLDDAGLEPSMVPDERHHREIFVGHHP